MFDFGFSELILVVLVALVVLSPRDFARVSRTLGEWVSKGRRYWHELSEQVKQENALKDVKAFREEITQQVRQISSELTAQEQMIKKELESGLVSTSDQPSNEPADLNADSTIVGLTPPKYKIETLQKKLLTNEEVKAVRAKDPFANPYNLPPTYDELVEQVRSLHLRLSELEAQKESDIKALQLEINHSNKTGDSHVEP